MTETRQPDRLPDGSIDYAKEYDNSGRVANAARLIEAFTTDAAAYRASGTTDAETGLSYGPAERNRLDIFWPGDERGRRRRSDLVVFIHGGYWQRLSRSDFSHMAKGLTARGLAVALPSYTLCPNIDVAGIVNEIRRACILLWQTHKRRMVVTGHSAGGHLAAAMMATDWPAIHPDLPADLVCAGLGLSGLYELEPLIHTPVNDALGLDVEAAKAASPVFQAPPALHRFEAWVGGDESAEYHRQSRMLAERWTMLGTPTSAVTAAGANHFTIIDAMTRPDSELVNAIIALHEEPSPAPDITEPDAAAVVAALQDLPSTAAPSEEHEEQAGDGEEKPAKPVEQA